jgi:hypothetical protein
MATMESLIGLVNRIQRACTVLGDYGGEGMSLWEALPSVAVVGGQVSTSSHPFLRFTFVAGSPIFLSVSKCLIFLVDIRVPGNRRSWKVWLEGTSCLVDPVILHCGGADLSSYPFWLFHCLNYSL